MNSRPEGLVKNNLTAAKAGAQPLVRVLADGHPAPGIGFSTGSQNAPFFQIHMRSEISGLVWHSSCPQADGLPEAVLLGRYKRGKKE